MPTHELAIVGAGPIGLELAVECSKHGIDYLHFDARQIAHTMTWWAPQTRFFSSSARISIAGVPLVCPEGSKATREQYLAYLRSIVEMFDLKIRTFEPVTGIERGTDSDGPMFVLHTTPRDGPATHRVRRLVLATGGTERPRRLNIPGEDLPHVSHYLNDPHLYFGQRLLIVGGRNSAAEAALRCFHTGAHVTLSYRQPQLPRTTIKYWIYPELEGLIGAGRIKAEFDTQPVEISPSHVMLRHADGTFKPHRADFVLLLTGYEADMTLFRLAGVELKPHSLAPVFDESTMQTNVPNLFVAGTAAAGTQERYALFIENCHVHVDRIVSHILGRPVATSAAPDFALPES
jgi:thioredoxin reductase (NADPH)